MEKRTREPRDLEDRARGDFFGISVALVTGEGKTETAGRHSLDRNVREVSRNENTL